MSNQKGFSKVAVIIIVLILIGGVYFVFSKKDKNIPSLNTVEQNNKINSIKNININSIYPASGSIGTKITLIGENFKQPYKEVEDEWGLLDVSINFGKYEMEGGYGLFNVVDNNTIEFSIPDELCKETLAKAGGCLDEDIVKITPGTYEISFMGSNKVLFIVTN